MSSADRPAEGRGPGQPVPAASDWQFLQTKVVTAAPGPEPEAAAKCPDRLGRYRIIGKLGTGGFGVVYQGYDDELRREVAIKVPHPARVSSAEDAEAYLAEGRVLAGLDHPGIVPVYDVGRTEDDLCYLVSKRISGTDLATRMAKERLPHADAVELVALVALALHHAHQRGLVHRDIKPGNILLDAGGRPVVVDFGLALKEENYGEGPVWAGTPAYMSPEQARGEGHRVDARTDVYSLGMVLYELLAGRLPFAAGSIGQLLDQITLREPRPPRQLDESIPRELDRICLKALAKRAADRYSTARDLADDLRHWQAAGAGRQSLASLRPLARSATAPFPQQRTHAPEAMRVVPRGLRAFDAEDADFFLRLLPGPRDRDGLPESVRFWQTRVESLDEERAFSVGLVYGPSGCGKSSMVKAALLPRLARHVVAVYLEATPADMELRIEKAISRRCAGIPADERLPETLAALRRGQYLPRGQKVLLVLDQFEQWLHANSGRRMQALVAALRQCDGIRVQAILMIRDDFWMAATRFMRDLEVPVVEGQNSAAVDLFDLRHARQVLAGFGQALGCLPEDPQMQTSEQDRFLDRAVADLAVDEKIVPVRLTLFAEMVKSRSWVPATLKDSGGAGGVGVRFLEETFSSASALPRHRRHQVAARAILGALLPEEGSDIKGHMQPRLLLLEASGYARRPVDFEDLMRLLDNELRLVTPTDPGDEPEGKPGGTAFFQLAHDYLVPSVRSWLNRHKRASWRGRAELRLAERAGLWISRRRDQLLPAWWEWVNILLFTRRTDWTGPQRQMMRRARAYHGLRIAIALVSGALAVWGGRQLYGSARASALLERLRSAEPAEALEIIRRLEPYRRWAAADLRSLAGDVDGEARLRTNASLALIDQPEQLDYLYERLLEAKPDDLMAIRQALMSHSPSQISARLWSVATDDHEPMSRRFRAACALAKNDPEDTRWTVLAQAVSQHLIRENPLWVPGWARALENVKGRMIEPLSVMFRDPQRADGERQVAAGLLADYCAGAPDRLCDLIQDANAEQYAVLFPRLAAHGAEVENLLAREMLAPVAPDPAGSNERLVQRKAQAAVTLARLGRPEAVWPLLRNSPDPRVRSWLVPRLGPLGADPRPIIDRLARELETSSRDTSLCVGLILSAGELGDRVRTADREVLGPRLVEAFRTCPDPGVHSALDWLLRRWSWPGFNSGDRRIDRELTSRDVPRDRRWYVNTEGQTFAIVDAPGEFWMGSPEKEPGRTEFEWYHRVRIDRRFAMGVKKISRRQFDEFLKRYPRPGSNAFGNYASAAEDPACPVTWFEAAKYCRWLSEQEHISPDQMCFPEVAKIGPDMKLPANYLSRSGYRLPTEAEWEFACRAGTATARYYGASDELLPYYAWCLPHSADRTTALGRFKPNDLGMFDMLGNAWEWCLDRFRGQAPSPAAGVCKDEEDRSDIERVPAEQTRAVRGGFFDSRPRYVRCAVRDSAVPTTNDSIIGFRLARTIP